MSRLIVPSTALLDIQALGAQIELRRRALRDIEVIRSRLRLWGGYTAIGLPRRRKDRPARQASLSRLRRGKQFKRPA